VVLSSTLTDHAKSKFCFFAYALKKNASTHFSTFAFAPTAQATHKAKSKELKFPPHAIGLLRFIPVSLKFRYNYKT